MKIARLVGLSLVAGLVLSLLPAATALAESSNPLFNPANGQKLTGKSLVTLWVAEDGETIECQKDSLTGAITSSLLLGKLIVHYLECTAKEKPNATTTCTIKSVGASEEGLILLKELHGILGLILSPAPLDTGILFLPTAGKIITELAESKNGGIKCTPETKVTGTVAGLITPVGKSQLTSKIFFPAESIKKIDLTHGIGLREPELVMFSTVSSLVGEEKLEFAEATEVT